MTRTAQHNDAFSCERPAPARTRASLARGLLIAAAAAAVLAGCTETNRHSVIVGSVPDDYRTNHPIVIGERERVLDLPVGASSYGMTKFQRTRLDGFLVDYNPREAGYVAVLVPAGSANEAAALRTSGQITGYMNGQGVARDRIMVQSYQSPVAEASPPIRISYSAMKAYTDKCGRWPADALETTDNKHYADFGCSSQNNLAAQIANPTDLLGPRRPGTIDAENRDVAIGDYKAHNVSGDFVSNSEVDY